MGDQSPLFSLRVVEWVNVRNLSRNDHRSTVSGNMRIIMPDGEKLLATQGQNPGHKQNTSDCKIGHTPIIIEKVLVLV
jgi:hypothetical protein